MRTRRAKQELLERLENSTMGVQDYVVMDWNDCLQTSAGDDRYGDSYSLMAQKKIQTPPDNVSLRLQIAMNVSRDDIIRLLQRTLYGRAQINWQLKFIDHIIAQKTRDEILREYTSDEFTTKTFLEFQFHADPIRELEINLPGEAYDIGFQLIEDFRKKGESPLIRLEIRKEVHPETIVLFLLSALLSIDDALFVVRREIESLSRNDPQEDISDGVTWLPY